MSDHALDEIRAARRELDAAIDEIRKIPGFEDFLQPPTFADVVAAAAPTPIVYLAAAEPGGLALIVRGEHVEHVPLDELTAETLRERADRHLGSYAAYRSDPDARRAAWGQSLDDLCAWLWSTVMEPVLDQLAGADAATLVAGGFLGLLPLHAAWTADKATKTGRRYAIDMLPLSYAPNARALTAARVLANGDWARNLLAVVEPRPVSGTRLPCAALEGEVAASLFPTAPIVLSGGLATPRNFANSASAADILHLACHGFADLAAPLESGLRLAGDRDVTLRDLLAMRLRVRLAVLSACETSLPGTELPDEVVALPTGLLQAGVAGVVASMWAVPDRATAMLMTDFYRRWRCESRSPAQALQESQAWVRDTTNDEKRETWRQAVADGAAWLPERVAEDFIEALRYFEGDQCDHAEIRAWGAFAHVGA